MDAFDDDFEFIVDELEDGDCNECDDECNHEWRIDYVKNAEVCVNCGLTKELEEFADSGEVVDTIAIDANQINIKGISRKMKRFYLWHASPSYAIRSFNEDLRVIKEIGDKIGLSSMICDDAKLIYKRFKELIGFGGNNKYVQKSTTKKQRIAMMQKHQNDDEDFKDRIMISNCRLRGDSKIGLLCGCLYYACYKNGFCIICNVFAECANIKPKYVHKGCNVLIQMRNTGDEKLNMLMPVVCMPYPINYLKTVCDGFESICEIKISDKQRKEIMICMLNSQKHKLIVNHNPHSFAIGIAFMYLIKNKIINYKFSKKVVADYFGICQPTINTTYKELVFNQDMIFDYSKDIDELKCEIEEMRIDIDKERFKRFFKGISSNDLNLDIGVIQSLEM